MAAMNDEVKEWAEKLLISTTTIPLRRKALAVMVVDRVVVRL